MLKGFLFVFGGIILSCLILILVTFILGVARIAMGALAFILIHLLIPGILFYILYLCVRFLER